MRLIYINRRGYQGSTAYNTNETAVLSNGTSEERTEFLNTEGAYLGLLVDGLSQALNLSGPTTVLGWSLGTPFAMAFITSVTSDIDEAVIRRLQDSVTSVILLEPTTTLLGIANPPGTYQPGSIQSISSLNTFYIWLTSYFNHGDLSTRALSVIEQRMPETLRPGTLQRMSGLDLLNISEIVSGPDRAQFTLSGDPGFLEPLEGLVNRTNLDGELCRHWPRIGTSWLLYGDSTFRFMGRWGWRRGRGRGFRITRRI